MAGGRLQLGSAVMSDLDSDDINDEEDLEGDLDQEVDMEDEDFGDSFEGRESAGSPPAGDNARRRVEEYLEMKRAAKELADLDTYDFD